MKNISQARTVPLQVEVDGRIWKLFDVYFTDSDGRKYSFYIYAINREHASYIVEDIKNTAELAPGDIIGFIDRQPDRGNDNEPGSPD